MSKVTTNLGLYEADTTVDGNNTFNVKTMLNDNWDKIDAKVKEIDDKVVIIPVTKVNGKTGDVVLSASDVGAATTAQGTKADNAIPSSQKGVTGGVAAYDAVAAQMNLKVPTSQVNQDVTTAASPSFRSLKLEGLNAGLDLGSNGSNTPFVDFHSGSTAVDYDSRIIASGGNGTSGDGILEAKSQSFIVNELVTRNGVDGIGIKPAFSWNGTLPLNGSGNITHGLSYEPIVAFNGTTGNIILTHAPESLGVTRVSAYSSGGGIFTGTINFY